MNRTLTLFTAIVLGSLLAADPGYAAPGDLDPTFDGDGIAITPVGPGAAGDHGTSVALQSDGKIVVAGTSDDGSFRDFAVVRYNTNGSLDTTFGTGGTVRTDIGSGSGDDAKDVELQDDGKIVVAGNTSAGTSTDFAVVRYNADGTLDGTFGAGGKVTTDFGGTNDQANALAIQSDGRIVVVGNAQTGTYPDTTSDFVLARYNADGSLDTTFGTGGRVVTDSGSDIDQLRGVAVRNGGKIVVAGYSQTGGSYAYDFAVAQYNPGGTLDATFGAGGLVTTPIGPAADMGDSMVLQPDGKILVAGCAYIAGNSYDFAVVRYDTDGSLDSQFGTAGIVITPIGSNSDRAYGVALLRDGKIVVAGQSHDGNANDFAVARYTSNGSLDGTFGTGGKVTTSIVPGHDTGRGVALQSDGRIVVVGEARPGGDFDFAVARYLVEEIYGVPTLTEWGAALLLVALAGLATLRARRLRGA